MISLKILVTQLAPLPSFMEFMAHLLHLWVKHAVTHSAETLNPNFLGLGTNQLLKNYSMRSIGITGSLIYFTGAFTSVFAEDVPQLVFTFGFLQGFVIWLFEPLALFGKLVITF